MESEDDLSIEAEIQRELDKLTEADLETSESSNNEEISISDNSLSAASPEVLPEGFDKYIQSLQQQTSAFELDLAECDDLLKQSVEITSSRDVVPVDTDLEQALAEQGGTLEELKLKILEDLATTDNDYDSDLDDTEDETSTQDTDNEEEKDKALVLVTEEQLELRQLLASQREKVHEHVKKQEEQLAQIIEKERHEEEVFEQELENKRQEKIQQMEREESRILTERRGQKEEEERQQKVMEQQLEEEMKKQQKKIQELEETARKEKEEWESRKKEEQIKQELKRQNSAVKIQSVYRGYSTRKQYKAEVDSRRSEAREKIIQDKVKHIEEEQKKMEEEEERQKIVEEENKRKEEEKRLKEEKRKEEEKKKKEEEERKKQEEAERKQKEKEEKLRRDEDKKKKAEEEKLRKEEEKRLKAEEKKRIEEEKKQKAEEEKQRKEEEKRRKKEEEERKKNEEIERKKKEEEERIRKQEEEKQKAIEKEKQEKEEIKRLKAEQQKKELEKIRKEEMDKQEEELKKQEEKLKEFLSEESKDVNENKISSKIDNPVNGSVGDRGKQSPRKSVRQSKENFVRESSNAESDDSTVSTSKVIKNGVSVMEGLPSHMESKRLGWIKSCTPWSKVSNEPWKLKATTSKRPARRPSSAKKLALLEENIILSAAKVASLRQVTTVELQDLPGSNMSSLGHCTGLQCLKMVNCNLVAIEGLQQCKQLQYLDLKNNYIEYLDLKGLGNIKVIDLSHNMISVIHGMEGCTDVRWLDLSNNKITRLGGLNGLRRLHTLNLANNQLINIQGIGDTPTIQQLDLSHNHLQEVEDINKLCLLQHLNLTGNNLLEIPDLRNHVLLQDLSLDDNNITSLERLLLYWLPLVQKLNISQNSLEDLVSLENLLLLREVDLGNNQISDIDVFQSSLQNCIYVEMLSLCGNPAVESLEDVNSFRNKLSESLSRLHQIDDCTVDSKLYGTPVKPRNSFEAMCLHQVQMIKDVHHRFQGDLKSHSDTSNLHELCEIYFKYCDKTHKMAEEFRYAHEYGEVSVTVPTAPTTPKSGRPRSARVNKSLQDSYMSPKEMFERALQGGGGSGGTNGMVRSDNIAVVKPVVTAKLVQNIIEDDPASQKKLNRRNQAATKIQSLWRGYSVRKEINQALQDLAVLEELHKAATKIQALWRGYNLRCKLERALDFAKFEDDEELGEVDLGDFNFNEDLLDDWKPPPTPVMPNSHPVLGKPPSGKKLTPPKVPALHLGDTPHPPPPPKRAWRGMDSPLSDIQQHHHPRPPSSLVSATDTHRTAASKKEEKISEEWGFKDNQTAHLMLQRAKKMKYNAERRKKLSKLDPKQRLLLYRKLEETAHYPHVQASRKVLPRKEYFQERQKEIDNAAREKIMEKSEKQSRTFEWLHTQVGDYEVTDSHINTHNTGIKQRQRFGSEGNLPRLDSGKPVRLISSPIDLQSVDSVSIQGDIINPRRFSAGSSDSQSRLPPIKGGSAPTGQKKERMSFRNPRKNTEIGWGSGKRRVVH